MTRFIDTSSFCQSCCRDLLSTSLTISEFSKLVLVCGMLVFCLCPPFPHFHCIFELIVSERYIWIVTFWQLRGFRSQFSRSVAENFLTRNSLHTSASLHIFWHIFWSILALSSYWRLPVCALRLPVCVCSAPPGCLLRPHHFLHARSLKFNVQSGRRFFNLRVSFSVLLS